MRTTLTLALVFLISGVWLQAQDAGKTNGKSYDLTTIEGCLQMSQGQYDLVDDAEMIHHLSGGAAKLKHLVDHQVEITGKIGTRTIATTPAGAGSSAVTQWIIEVKSVKQIADTCK